MKKKINWPKVIFLAGVVAMVAGVLDPLEGSVVITTGSILVTIGAFLQHDRFMKLFLLSFLLIAIGVAAMFYLSSLGGFGGSSSLSWWWGLFILPYPAGWLMAMAVLIIRAVRNSNQPAVK
jgi:hypothetical protein